MDDGAGARTFNEESLPDARADRASAFRALAERHLDDAYRLARLILGDPVEAEDATHDAFLAAWRGWSGLRDPGRFDAWFGRILVNTCRGRLRTIRRRQVVDVSLVLEARDRGPDPHAALLGRAEMEQAFGALSVDHRIVLALRFYADLPVDQIAGRLGVPSGTVKSRLHLALQALETALRSTRREDER